MNNYLNDLFLMRTILHLAIYRVYYKISMLKIIDIYIVFIVIAYNLTNNYNSFLICISNISNKNIL